MQCFNKFIIIVFTFVFFVNVNICTDKIDCNNSNLNSKNNILYQEKTINFLNWANYISPYFICCVKKLFNTNIKFEYTTSDSITRTKIITGKSDIDILLQGSLYLPDGIKLGSFVALDKDKLPNWKYRNQKIYEKVALNCDLGNIYGVVYTYGTTGIAYNQDCINKLLGDNVVLDSWKYLYDPYFLKKLSKYGVSLLDDPEQIFGNYFQYIGINPNTTNKRDYEKAALYFIHNVRPYIKYFSSSKYQHDLVSGNLCVVMGYSGDIIRAIERIKETNNSSSLKYILPKEGTNIWFDMIMISNNSKNIEEAYKVLNLIMDPYVSAQNSNFLYQASGVSCRYNSEYLQQAFYDFDMDLSSQNIDNMYVLKLHSPSLQSFINEMWTYVKYGISFAPKYRDSTS